jgi:hypothetical protein
VRCAGQDDDPHSGSRGIFARAKPDKHSPGLRDGEEAAKLLLGADNRSCRGGIVPPALVPFRMAPALVGDGVLDIP